MVLSACDLSDNEITTTLTIKNESSHELIQVFWNNVSFTSGMNSISPGEYVTMDVNAGSGYVRFRPRLNIQNLRSGQLLVVEEGERIESIVTDNTIVVRGTDNASGTLSSNASPKIGDIGLGGGIIFFMQGVGQFMEVSNELGPVSITPISTVKSIVQNYKGGGFTDWRLPTIGELIQIYQNLKQTGLENFHDYSHYSSSTDFITGSYIFLDFSNGTQKTTHSLGDLFSVRAVRAFSLQ
jgi:hypothetical protein